MSKSGRMIRGTSLTLALTLASMMAMSRMGMLPPYMELATRRGSGAHEHAANIADVDLEAGIWENLARH
jgi:hypothetical protein